MGEGAGLGKVRKLLQAEATGWLKRRARWGFDVLLTAVALTAIVPMSLGRVAILVIGTALTLALRRVAQRCSGRRLALSSVASVMVPVACVAWLVASPLIVLGRPLYVLEEATLQPPWLDEELQVPGALTKVLVVRNPLRKTLLRLPLGTHIVRSHGSGGARYLQLPLRYSMLMTDRGASSSIGAEMLVVPAPLLGVSVDIAGTFPLDLARDASGGVSASVQTGPLVTTARRLGVDTVPWEWVEVGAHDVGTCLEYVSCLDGGIEAACCGKTTRALALLDRAAQLAPSLAERIRTHQLFLSVLAGYLGGNVGRLECLPVAHDIYQNLLSADRDVLEAPGTHWALSALRREYARYGTTFGMRVAILDSLLRRSRPLLEAPTRIRAEPSPDPYDRAVEAYLTASDVAFADSASSARSSQGLTALRFVVLASASVGISIIAEPDSINSIRVQRRLDQIRRVIGVLPRPVRAAYLLNNECESAVSALTSLAGRDSVREAVASRVVMSVASKVCERLEMPRTSNLFRALASLDSSRIEEAVRRPPKPPAPVGDWWQGDYCDFQLVCIQRLIVARESMGQSGGSPMVELIGLADPSHTLSDTRGQRTIMYRVVLARLTEGMPGRFHADLSRVLEEWLEAPYPGLLASSRENASDSLLASAIRSGGTPGRVSVARDTLRFGRN